MNLEVNDYVIIFMIIIIIYLVYKKYINESFAVTSTDSDITMRINDTFKADLSSIVNLGQVLNNLNTDGNTCDISNINNTIVNDLNASTIECDNLIINGDINILDINNLEKHFSIYPRYMIMIWAQQTIPKGWALCDGSAWYINVSNNMYLREDEYDKMPTVNGDKYEKITVPDLQNRFILGAANDNTNHKYSLGRTGGAEKVALNNFDIPAHYHSLPFAMMMKDTSNPNAASTKSFNISGDNADGYIDDGLYISPSLAMPAISKHHYKGISFSIERDRTKFYKYIMSKYSDPKNKFASHGYAVQTDYARQINEPPSYTSKPHENMPPYCKLFYIMKL